MHAAQDHAANGSGEFRSAWPDALAPRKIVGRSRGTGFYHAILTLTSATSRPAPLNYAARVRRTVVVPPTRSSCPTRQIRATRRFSYAGQSCAVIAEPSSVPT